MGKAKENQPANNMRHPEKLWEWFTVQLTDDELLAKGNNMTEILDAINDLENEKKRIAAEFKVKIDERREELFQVSRIYKNKSEERELQVWQEYDLKTKYMLFIECDSGQEMGRRPMKPQEIAAAQQYEIDFEFNEQIQEILNKPADDDNGDGPDIHEPDDMEPPGGSPDGGGEEPPVIGPDDGLDDDPIDDPEDRL